MNLSEPSVWFEPEEKARIDAFAKMRGITFSDQVRQWTLERLEDETDACDLKIAIAEDDGQRIKWSDVDTLGHKF